MIILEAYPETITFKEAMFNIIFWSILLLLYATRNVSEINRKIWDVVQMFFTVLLLILGANYAKKEIKEWWNKK